MPELRFPYGLDDTGFLRGYWQRKPLFMSGALGDYRCPLTPNELAGLSCDADVESRVVIKEDAEAAWRLYHGPFDEQYFATLPRNRWTLLVQDVEKHVPQLANLLGFFQFLPDWRIDDVMVSFAADGGSVGPHVDEYDVFLFQALGKRHWQIHTRPVSESDFIPELELRVLRDFDAQQQWVLGPGDMLYLPPGVAHWGVAIGDCMTCSVGFRTPAFHELLASRCEDIIEQFASQERYRDPALSPQTARTEIQSAALDQALELIGRCENRERDSELCWFGRLVTETKANLTVHPRPKTLSDESFRNTFCHRATLYRNTHSRLAFSRGSRKFDYLFVNGACHELASLHGDFLPLITEHRELPYEQLESWLSKRDCLRLLCRLYNDGHFEFE